MLTLSTLLATTWVNEGTGNYPAAPPGLTSAEVGALIGVSGPIQMQLDGKADIEHDHDGVYEPRNPNLVKTDDLATLNLNGGYF